MIRSIILVLTATFALLIGTVAASAAVLDSLSNSGAMEPSVPNITPPNTPEWEVEQQLTPEAYSVLMSFFANCGGMYMFQDDNERKGLIMTAAWGNAMLYRQADNDAVWNDLNMFAGGSIVVKGMIEGGEISTEQVTGLGDLCQNFIASTGPFLSKNEPQMIRWHMMMKQQKGIE